MTHVKKNGIFVTYHLRRVKKNGIFVTYHLRRVKKNGIFFTYHLRRVKKSGIFFTYHLRRVKKNGIFFTYHHLDLIIKAITQHDSMTRKEIDELLWKKLPDWMSDKQRKIKIMNLLAELRINNKIKHAGTYKIPKWVKF
jgi:hypothetical protein